MADLSELVGALLASLAQARRIVDEETAAIAEYYRDNPLLEGMSVPRIRVPELLLDLPVILESFEGEAKTVLNDNNKIIKPVMETLNSQLKRFQVTLAAKYKNHFKSEIEEGLNRLRSSDQMIRREHVVRIVDVAFSHVQKDANLREHLKPPEIKRITSALRNAAGANALNKEGSPPRIEATIITAQIKDQAGPKNVARLRILMKEEGMEWDVVEQTDGTIKATLSPE